MYIATLSVLVLVAVVGQGFLVAGLLCPPGLVSNDYLQIYDKWCFEFVFQEKLSYDEASNDCKVFGGTLALVKDSDTQAFLFKQLQDYVNKDNQDYAPLWIGLNDKVNEGTFVWEDGTNATYSNWQQGAGPDSGSFFGSFKDCVAIGTFDGKWTDQRCTPDIFEIFEEENRHYICQYEGDEGGNPGTSAGVVSTTEASTV